LVWGWEVGGGGWGVRCLGLGVYGVGCRAKTDHMSAAELYSPVPDLGLRV
jgi:hypothetical protein